MDDSYSARLAKVIQVSRFIVVLKAAHLYMDPNTCVTHKTFTDTVKARHEIESEPPLPNPDLTGSDPIAVEAKADPKPQVRSIVDWIELMVRSFMVRGTRSPTQWIFDSWIRALESNYYST
jgi:hypothetical protein